MHSPRATIHANRMDFAGILMLIASRENPVYAIKLQVSCSGTSHGPLVSWRQGRRNFLSLRFNRYYTNRSLGPRADSIQPLIFPR